MTQPVMGKNWILRHCGGEIVNQEQVMVYKDFRIFQIYSDLTNFRNNF
jgi:hypothetical protein